MRRRFLAGCAKLGTFALTFEPVLAREVHSLALTRPTLKDAARRMAWYARRFGVPVPAPRDLMHVFCENLDHVQTSVMRRFLLRRHANTSNGLLLSELCLLSAQAMLAALPAGRPPLASAYLARLAFEADVNAMLDRIHQGAAPDYGQSAPSKNRFSLDKADAARALADVTARLTQDGIRNFILSGTLLGAVREGDFLPHDYDIDLGVMGEEVEIGNLIALFESAEEFTVLGAQSQICFTPDAEGKLSVRTTPVVLKIAHSNGIPIDVFLHYRDGETLWHGTDLYRWDNRIFTLSPYQLGGVTVDGPTDADLFLTENYGNWRIPKSDFQCALDTPNQSIVPNPMSVALCLRRAWLELARDRAASAGLLAHLAQDGYLEGTAETGYRLAKSAFAIKL